MPFAIITQPKPPDPIHVLPNILRLLICGLLSGSLLNATSTAGEPTRRFIAADSSKNTVAIIDETGKTEWEHKIGPLHDLHVLPNGHVLLQLNWTEVVEINPTNGKIEWRYDAKKRRRMPASLGDPCVSAACQREYDGCGIRSGNVDRTQQRSESCSCSGIESHQADAHRDTRLVRKLSTGNYLVCHEGDGLVREYDPTGKTVWEYEVPLFDRKPAGGHGVEAFGNQCFSAIRLVNGTL